MPRRELRRPRRESRLVRQHHPDAGGSAEQFPQVQDAYEAAIRAVAP